MPHQEIPEDVVEFFAKELFEKEAQNDMTWCAEFVERGLPSKAQAGDEERDAYRTRARKDLENDPQLFNKIHKRAKERQSKRRS